MRDARISTKGTILARIVEGKEHGYSDRVIAEHLGVDVTLVSSQVAMLRRAGRLPGARPCRRGPDAALASEVTISNAARARIAMAATRRAITPLDLTNQLLEVGSEIIDAILDDRA
jgi:hypothetical protein